MNTKFNEGGDGRRRRRSHSAEFKAQAVAACRQRGVSIAAVALARGLNANLLRRWVIESEQGEHGSAALRAGESKAVEAPAQLPVFVPLQLPAASTPADIRIELRRGVTAITVIWPSSAAAECAGWMRELLR